MQCCDPEGRVTVDGVSLTVNEVVDRPDGALQLVDLLLGGVEERRRETQRHAATHRILDHYLHTANTAARLLYPDRDGNLWAASDLALVRIRDRRARSQPCLPASGCIARRRCLELC